MNTERINDGDMSTDENIMLVGCGILAKEIDYIIGLNKWTVTMVPLNSMFHNYFDRMESALSSALARYSSREKAVFYGCCHPLMHEILEKNGTKRTIGQNCIEILLGKKLFDEKLRDGAFFLLEEWASRWEVEWNALFGNDRQVAGEIFRENRKYILGVRTPCSEDFSSFAQAAADFVQVPLYWMDAPLDHLEETLHELLVLKGGTQ